MTSPIRAIVNGVERTVSVPAIWGAEAGGRRIGSTVVIHYGVIHFKSEISTETKIKVLDAIGRMCGAEFDGLRKSGNKSLFFWRAADGEPSFDSGSIVFNIK